MRIMVKMYIRKVVHTRGTVKCRVKVQLYGFTKTLRHDVVPMGRHGVQTDWREENREEMLERWVVCDVD